MSRVRLSKAIAAASGLREEDRATARDLVDVWERHLDRNRERTTYYLCKAPLKNLGIAVPEGFEDAAVACDWPSKAVSALACRSVYDGWSFEGGYDPSAFLRVIDDNQVDMLYPQAVSGQLVHGCAFSTVGAGGDGEPEAVVSLHSAETASALWDFRRKRIAAGLTVVDTERRPGSREQRPVWVNLYLSDSVVELRADTDGKWEARYLPHRMGRPLMEPLVYRPSLGRPFGVSRITRAVMDITDCACREMLRAEIASELYTTPQKYILAADDDAFDWDKWKTYIGSIMVIGKDEDGDVPTVGQFPQMSMQPHMEYMRSLAAQFAGVTNVPVSTLGIVQDNPSSAQAIYAASEPLVVDAMSLNRSNRRSMRNVALMVMAVMRGVEPSMLTDAERSVSFELGDPSMPSMVSQADAVVKIATADPSFAGTDVFYEAVGIDEGKRRRLRDEKRRSQGGRLLDVIMQPQAAGQESAPEEEVADDGDDTGIGG